MPLAGLGPALLAAVAFGVQYVPVKKYKIYDGITFQWFMCSGILFVGFFAALLLHDLDRGIPPLVVLGGCLWAVSNYLVLPLVKLLGIGLGFSLYHFVNMVVGYVVGRRGLFGVSRLRPAFEGSLVLCDAGCLLILASFVVMLRVEAAGADREVARPASRTPAPVALGAEGDRGEQDEGGGEPPFREVPVPGNARLLESTGFSVFALECGAEAPEEAGPEAGAPAAPGAPREPGADGARGGPSAPAGRRCLAGASLAILAGSLAGLQSVPAALHDSAHPDDPPSAVVFPQCLGVWFMSTAIYLVYGFLARLRKKAVHHSVIRPAFFSGCIWALGFLFMIKGITQLGFAVGYTLDAVGPIGVASVISICFFKEITERRQLMIYFAAEALQLLGVVLITAFSKH